MRKVILSISEEISLKIHVGRKGIYILYCTINHTMIFHGMGKHMKIV